MYLLFVDRFLVRAGTRHGRAYGVAVSSCPRHFNPISSVSVTPMVFTAHKVSARQYQIGLKTFKTCEVCWLKVEQCER